MFHNIIMVSDMVLAYEKPRNDVLTSSRGYFVFKNCCALDRADSQLFENVLNGVVGNHLFLEGVSTGLRRLNDLDDLAISAAFAFCRDATVFFAMSQ